MAAAVDWPADGPVSRPRSGTTGARPGRVRARPRSASQPRARSRPLGYAIGEVSDALETVFHLNAEAAATILKGLGYAADQIATALQDVWGASEDLVEDIMEGIGFTFCEIFPFVPGC